jgi:hypothetical protein
MFSRLASTIDAQDKGVTLDTHSKYARSWRIWNEFLKKIPTNDKYLNGFTQNERNTILCVFMDTVKNGKFNKQSKSVQGTTAQKDADNVAKIIEASGWPDPRLTESGKQSLQYKRQTSNYKSRDGASKHQKALPPEVYRWWIRQATHNREKARANLLAGALFFGMRSCEYSKTPKSETQKTLPIRPCDIVFCIGNEVIDHNDNRITIADSVEITFVLQKNGEVEDQILQFHTNDIELCPVKHWSYNIQRLCSYPNYNPTWPVYYYFDVNTNKTSHISSHEIIIDIRASVDGIGEKILGFTSKDVGTHSNRAAFAMMHYLAGTPVFTLMLLGRWMSGAFLRYIEKQVKEFSIGASDRMLTCNTFYNLPVRPWTKTDTANSLSAARFRATCHNITGHTKNLLSNLCP